MTIIDWEELKQAFDDVLYALKSFQNYQHFIADNKPLGRNGLRTVNRDDIIVQNELIRQYKEALIHADNIIGKELLWEAFRDGIVRKE